MKGERERGAEQKKKRRKGRTERERGRDVERKKNRK